MKSDLEVARLINLALLMCDGISEQDAGFDTITGINDAGLEKISKIVAALRSPSPYSGAERLWCKACGTVTRDGRCDCNRWGADHEMTREPNFVNYADAMQESAQELQAEVNRLNDLLVPTTLPRDAERDANRKDAEEFCKGAFGPFVTDVSQYVQIVTELLEHASNRATGYCHNGNSPREEL